MGSGRSLYYKPHSFPPTYHALMENGYHPQTLMAVYDIVSPQRFRANVLCEHLTLLRIDSLHLISGRAL